MKNTRIFSTWNGVSFLCAHTGYHEGPCGDAAFLHPRHPSQLAAAVHAESAAVAAALIANATGQDGRHSGPDGVLALAGDEGGVPDRDAGDVHDRICRARGATERHAEVAGSRRPCGRSRCRRGWSRRCWCEVGPQLAQPASAAHLSAHGLKVANALTRQINLFQKHPNCQIGKFIGSRGYTAKEHQDWATTITGILH